MSDTKANSGRWIQWQWKAQDPPGECKSDLQVAYELFKKLQEAYAGGSGAFPDPIVKMKWDYGKDEDESQVDVVKVCLELNGYNTADQSLVTNFVSLQDDGSIAWHRPSGYYNNLENPACKSRIRRLKVSVPT